MAVRPTMARLIQQVRDLTGATTSDYTIGSTTYWSDQQIQDVLDRQSRAIVREPLTAQPRYTSSGVETWLVYRSAWLTLEDQASDGTLLILESTSGLVDYTTYTVETQRGLVTFTSDQQAKAYWLTGRAYDVYGAAAALLVSWAAYEKLQFSFANVTHRYERQQKYLNLTDLAGMYRAMGWMTTAEMVRGDVMP